jgi:hypothetical protein
MMIVFIVQYVAGWKDCRPCLLQRVLMTFKVLTYRITITEFLCAPVSRANMPDCVHVTLDRVAVNLPDCVHITLDRVAVCVYVRDAQIPHARSPSN